MRRYLLTLLVTIEEERAIRELYSFRKWLFHKYENKDVTSPLGYSSQQWPHQNIATFSGQDERGAEVNVIDLLESADIERDHSKPGGVDNTIRLSFPERCLDSVEIYRKDGVKNTNKNQYNSDLGPLNVDLVRPELVDVVQDPDKQCNSDNGLQQDEEERSSVSNLFTSDGISNFNKTYQPPDDSDNKSDKTKVQVDHVNPIGDNKTELHVEQADITEQNFTSTSQTVESKHQNVIGDGSKLNQIKQKNETGRKSRRIKGRKMINDQRFNIDDDGNNEESNLKSETKQGKFHCNECDVTFKLLGPFKNHKRDGKCIFTCEFCGKVFTSRYYYNYQIHLRYHRKDRAHQCDICGKSYIEANALKIHKRKHSNDRPYVCDICGKCFYSSSHLIYHKKSLHSETHEIHQCDLCGAVLSTLGNLRVHKQTVHIDGRPFTCEICGKAFKTKKALEQKHAKVHMNVYPYKCDFIGCDKAFKTSASLTSHVRRHNNQRSHFCERCGKGFYTKKDLTLHTRIHTGEKPYSCKFCDYSCTLAGNLRKHLKTHD